MIALLDRNPLASVIVVIVAIVGGVIAIVHPSVLSFSDYCRDLGIVAGGAGLLGIGRAMSGKGVVRRG